MIPGDPAYPLLQWLMKAFPNNGYLSRQQKTFNYCLSRALKSFGAFCSLYDILSPFPVSEALLCYFAAAMAREQLAPQTIKTYLSAIRYMQITLGLPEPREFSSLPRLRLVQTGINSLPTNDDYSRHYVTPPLPTNDDYRRHKFKTALRSTDGTQGRSPK